MPDSCPKHLDAHETMQSRRGQQAVLAVVNSASLGTAPEGHSGASPGTPNASPAMIA